MGLLSNLLPAQPLDERLEPIFKGFKKEHAGGTRRHVAKVQHELLAQLAPGEKPLILAAQAAGLNKDIVLITDRRSIQRQGRAFKSLDHADIADIDFTGPPFYTVTISTLSALRDYAEGDVNVWDQKIMVPAATPGQQQDIEAVIRRGIPS